MGKKVNKKPKSGTRVSRKDPLYQIEHRLKSLERLRTREVSRYKSLSARVTRMAKLLIADSTAWLAEEDPLPIRQYSIPLAVYLPEPEPSTEPLLVSAANDFANSMGFRECLDVPVVRASFWRRWLAKVACPQSLCQGL